MMAKLRKLLNSNFLVVCISYIAFLFSGGPGTEKKRVVQRGKHMGNLIDSQSNILTEVAENEWAGLLRFLWVYPACLIGIKRQIPNLSSYAIRDAEEYKNFCERPKDHRPHDEDMVEDIAEHLTTIHLSCCQRGKHCLYEGSTPPGGFPNSWNGASYCTSKLSIHKNGEVHTWEQGYDEKGYQVWGPKGGPYEFKPA